MSTELTGPLKDPGRIAQRAGLNENVVGDYADMILDRLREDDYQIPADARTYAAVVYVAARDEGVPVTAGEVADAAGVKETALSREFRRVVSELGINPGLVQPDAYVERFGDELDLPEETVRTALDLYEEGAESNMWANRTGAVSAALCLYAASRLTDADLTQKAFEEFGVSRTSIRKGYKTVLGLHDSEDAGDGKMRDEEDTDRLYEAVGGIHAEVGVPDLVREDAEAILDRVRGQEWVLGKSAEPIAAAAYWLAADRNRLDVSQEEVANAAGSHKVTVNRRVGAIRENADLDDL